MAQIRGVIGGFNGPGFKSMNMGRVTGTRGFLSSTNPFMGPAGFSPVKLFALGEQGVWYDPSDFGSMYQDSAGTSPVAAVGQPVGLLLDKSGRGNHAIQTTAANRPILTQDANGAYSLAFNGTNSSMATAASVNFTGTSQMSVFTGVNCPNLTTLTIGTVIEQNSTGFNSFRLFVPDSVSGEISYFSSSSTLNTGVVINGQASPFTAVITGQTDLVGGNISIRKNGAIGAAATPAYGGGVFTNNKLSIGVQSDSAIRFFNGRLYSLIARGASSAAQEIANTEAFINGKMGGVL